MNRVVAAGLAGAALSGVPSTVVTLARRETRTPVLVAAAVPVHLALSLGWAAVLDAYRATNPGAPRVGIADLSRIHGGRFGANFGGLGHASHQNGLDADVLYPRKDGTEARATKPSEVDQERAQKLLDLFVQAGAVKVFVGPHLHLKGPKNVVVPLIYHDDHMHVRISQRIS